MSDMQVANLMYEAACGNTDAADKMMRAAQLFAEINAMIALNDQRKDEGKAQAYGENEFMKVKDSYS